LAITSAAGRQVSGWPGDALARELPRRTVFQPGVGPLDLPAALDALREHAELVADAVAEAGQAQRGHGVEEARGQAAQTAVAQRGIGLQRRQVFQAGGACRGPLSGAFGERQRIQRVAHRAAHQEFHRQVIHAARLRGAVLPLAGHPAARKLLAGHLGDGLHDFGGRCLGRRSGHGTQQPVVDGGTDGGGQGGVVKHHAKDCAGAQKGAHTDAECGRRTADMQPAIALNACSLTTETSVFTPCRRAGATKVAG
jgi:hypothetical protein